MKFDNTKHDVEQLLPMFKILGIADDQILENSKQYFPPKIETQLLKIDNIDPTILQAGVSVLLFKLELPQTTNSSMLAHMSNMTDHVPKNDEKTNTQSQLLFMKHFIRLQKRSRKCD